jgi:NADPH-dependent ferric siderophore reductase
MSGNPAVATQEPDHAARAPRRVRHETRRRQLEVKQVDKVAAHMIRVALGGDLDGFTSLGFDDHVKLFFPDESIGPGAEPQTIARDYTPRLYDAKRNVLEIDFAIHDAGPATRWAEQASVGDALTIGGPRGSFIIPTNYDWHLLIGDETALPAIARRLTELPAGTRVAAVLEVADPSARMNFDTEAELHAVWRYRSESPYRGAALLQAVRETYLPEGEGYVWAAGESATMRAVRYHLCTERGVDKSRIRAASYWKQGAEAVHENLDD